MISNKYHMNTIFNWLDALDGVKIKINLMRDSRKQATNR